MLPVRPVALFSGDFAQQQPIATVSGKTAPVDGIKKHPQFQATFHHFHLQGQHQCTDSVLMAFLSNIRSSKPSLSSLEEFQHGWVLFHEPITAYNIIDAYKNHPSSLFLTVSNSATTFINSSIIDSLSHLPVIAFVTCYNDVEMTPLFNGMPLMLVQNRNKSISFVNGQIVTAHSSQGGTIIVKYQEVTL